MGFYSEMVYSGCKRIADRSILKAHGFDLRSFTPMGPSTLTGPAKSSDCPSSDQSQDRVAPSSARYVLWSYLGVCKNRGPEYRP